MFNFETTSKIQEKYGKFDCTESSIFIAIMLPWLQLTLIVSTLVCQITVST